MYAAGYRWQGQRSTKQTRKGEIGAKQTALIHCLLVPKKLAKQNFTSSLKHPNGCDFRKQKF